MKKFILLKIFQTVILILFLCGFGAAQNTSRALSAEDYFRRGVEQAESGKCEQAVAQFDRAIRLNPRNAEYFKMRGDCFKSLFQSDKALVDYDKAVELKPDYAEAFLSRARLYAFFVRSDGGIDDSIDYDDRAKADFDKAVSLNPQRAEFYVERAEFFIAEDRAVEKGLADLAKAIELNPVGAHPYLLMIDFYQKRGEFDKAITAATDYITKSGSGYDLRAEIYYAAGKYEQAVADYSVAIKQNNGINGLALEGRAKAYRKIGKIREAAADERAAKKLIRKLY